MERRHHFSIWYLITIITLMTIFNMYLVGTTRVEIPYSTFKNLVREGKVEEVVVSEKLIVGRLKEDLVISEISPKRFRLFKTVRVGDPELTRLLEEKGVKFKGEYESAIEKAIFSWVLPLLVFFGIWGYIYRKMGPGAGVMSFGRNRAKIYAESETAVTFDDVAGVDEAKEELKEIVQFLKTPQRYVRLGGRMPKGVLLVGPPGTGKTLLAKAVAGEAKVPFFSMSGSDFVEMFVGVGAARVRDLFQQAQEKAPCIIFIDELDALGKARGIGGVVGGHDEREQTLNQLLVEMDGFDSAKGVVIMAATNRPEILDPALLRPGRFDRHILVDRPDIKGREEILKVHLRNVKVADDVDVSVLAKSTPGFVGADLANVVNEAALLAARKGKSEVSMEDFEEAIERVVAGLEKRNRLINQREKKIVAYHETGHALVAAFTPAADEVRKISIIPRGIGALGYTLQLPTEDRYLMTRSELIGKIDVLLGGRAAELIVFGEESTGAQNDLQRATDIARSMVLEYGMSSTLGPVTFSRQRQPSFLGTGLPYEGAREYSEATAEKLDDEINRILEDRLEYVKKLLNKNRKLLDRIANTLLEKEVIEEEEFRKILEEEGVDIEAIKTAKEKVEKEGEKIFTS